MTLVLLTSTKSGVRWLSGRALDFQSRGPGFKTICGKASDFSIEWIGVQNHLLPFQNLDNFFHATLPMFFGRDTKSRWSHLPSVYARGSKRSHTGGKCVTCRGLKEWWSLSLTTDSWRVRCTKQAVWMACKSMPQDIQCS